MRYFVEEAVVEHPELSEKLKALDVLTSFPTARNLVLVVGGTGVGKTTILRTLSERINCRLSEAAKAAGQVGGVLVKLRPPEKGTFDFSALYRDVLHKLGAPLVERTRPIVCRTAGAANIPTLLVERDITALHSQALQDRFFREIKLRRLRALLVDESAAIFKTARPKHAYDRRERLQTQADIVKGIATHAESSVVLSGAYDFFDLSLSSAQNARRSTIVHLEPYDQDDKGIRGFTTAVMGLLCHLPAAHSIDVTAAVSELMLYGLGCVGTAAGILADGLRESIVDGKPLTMAVVRKYYYPEAALNVMRGELADGRARVNAFLRLEDLVPRGDSSGATTEGAIQHGADSWPVRAGRRLKPGETKPDHLAGATEAW